MLLHVHIRDLKVPVWFGVRSELAVDILVGTSLMNRYFWGGFPFPSEATLRNLKPLYLSAMERKN